MKGGTRKEGRQRRRKLGLVNVHKMRKKMKGDRSRQKLRRGRMGVFAGNGDKSKGRRVKEK